MSMIRSMKHIEIFICFTVCSLLMTESVAQPAFGDVFREYSWVPERLEVLGNKGLGMSIADKIDLEQAVRAEIAIEIANEHLGFDKISCCINWNQSIPVFYPGHKQKHPSPSLWFHNWYPVVPVLLSDIKSGNGNEIKLLIDTLCFDGKQHPNGKVTPEHPNGEWGLLQPWCPVYGVTLRIYYDSSKKQHAGGKLSSPTGKSAIGLNMPVKIS